MSGDILVTIQGAMAMVSSETEQGMLQNKHPTRFTTAPQTKKYSF